MAVITSHTNPATLPHYPLAVTVSADEWRVVQLCSLANEVAVWCNTAVDFSVFFFDTIDTDGPDDGDDSSASGTYKASACRQVAGNTTAATRQYPSYRIGDGRDHRKMPTYVAITAASGCTVYLEQYGGEQ